MDRSLEHARPNFRKYLDPQILARIDGLELRARLIVEGFFSGMHPSPRRGASVEFADHRAYAQGDSLKHIDWKVFARTDKYYVKQYEQETNLSLVLAVDQSASMSFRSAGSALSKYDYATCLAAAIAYLALQQQDAVGLAVFDERLRQFVRPSNSATHWKTIIHELMNRAGPTKTSLGRVLQELAERMSGRMLVVLLSDLLDEIKPTLRGFQHLRYLHHELVVWNIWDHAELTFPMSGPVLFESLESGPKLLADPSVLRSRYLQEVDRFQQQMRSGCGQMHIEWSVFDTSLPLDTALSSYLATRSAQLRKHSQRAAGRSA